jgi:DNA polymerase-1
MSADYSQVELRILAHLCGDPGLRQAFERGEDIHATTAAAIFGVPLKQVTSDQRRIAKAVNFGLAYGQGAFGLAQATGLSNAEAQKFIDAYFARFAQVKQYVEETKRKAEKIGIGSPRAAAATFRSCEQTRSAHQTRRAARRGASTCRCRVQPDIMKAAVNRANVIRQTQ